MRCFTDGRLLFKVWLLPFDPHFELLTLLNFDSFPSFSELSAIIFLIFLLSPILDHPESYQPNIFQQL
jgi:hypothetical protein